MTKSADDFSDHIRGESIHVANCLNTFRPYERSLVLFEAHSIWDERQAGQPKPHEAELPGGDDNASAGDP